MPNFLGMQFYLHARLGTQKMSGQIQSVSPVETQLENCFLFFIT